MLPIKALHGSPLQLFIVLFFSSAGIILTVISQFTGIFYYFDEHNIYHRSTFYHLSVALGLLPWLIRIEEENKKLEKTVRERTKELEAEKTDQKVFLTTTKAQKSM